MTKKQPILAIIEDKTKMWEHIFDHKIKGKSGLFHLVCCDCKSAYNACIATEKDGKISLAFEYDEELTEQKRK